MTTKVASKTTVRRKTTSRSPNRRAVKLLQGWLNEDREYDMRVGKLLDEGLKKDRFRLREQDESAS